MILYFSATGNTEYIAKEIAKRLDDECVNLLARIKNNVHTPLYSEKPKHAKTDSLVLSVFVCFVKKI